MSIAAALLDLVLPRRCVGCRSPVGPLCPACSSVGSAVVSDLSGLRTVAAAAYDGAVRAALLAYKERGRRDLAGPLGVLLARALGVVSADWRAPPVGVVLVTVPSARAAVAARGGDHVLRLARHAGPLAGLRVCQGALRLERSVRDSAGLDVREREANLAGAFAAAPAPPGSRAVLVDDIATTGATLREARRALTAAGWPVAGAAVVAATARRFPAIGSAHDGGLA